jgi:anti-sigma regulatory factor (Ser/Thr protein kinase)
MEPPRPTAALAAHHLRTLRFRMKSRRDAVPPTVERVLEAAGPADLSAAQCDNLAVAVAEALANAAVHGNRLRAGTTVRVTVTVLPGQWATVEVSDSGPGFDHGSVRDPTEPHHLLEPRGRGVFLMRRLVDGLEYNEAGNRVRLTVCHHERHSP